MTHSEKSIILEKAYKYKALWVGRIIKSYNLNAYDAEEIFSEALIKLAEWLELDRCYQFEFAVKYAHTQYRKFISVEYSEQNITEEPIKDIEQIDFEFLIYQKYHTLSDFYQKAFAKYIRDNKGKTAERLIQEFDTITKQLIRVGATTRFVNLFNPEEIFTVTTTHLQLNIYGQEIRYYHMESDKRKASLHGNELLNYVIDNNLSRISVKNMTKTELNQYS